jgi:hypothetical protein
MVRALVGGREFDRTADEVIGGMRGVQPEPIREHFVEVDGTAFPPKQVLAHVTGWDRLSFTTMEATRVLIRLGFVCRRVGSRPSARQVPGPEDLDDHQERGSSTIDRRLSAVESALAVAQEAIAALRDRVNELEARV